MDTQINPAIELLQSQNLTKERRDEINKAFILANDFIVYCLDHNIGPFSFEGERSNGGMTWSGDRNKETARTTII